MKKRNQALILIPLFVFLCLMLMSFTGGAEDKCEVRYYLNGELYATESYACGEQITEAPSVDIEGYSFLGWYSDRELTKGISFPIGVKSDLSIFGSTSLDAPSFSISSYRKVYDAREYSFGLDNLHHPLEADGAYSFTWYKNSETVSHSERVKISKVSDSGSYYCKLIFAYKGDYVEISTSAVEVEIQKKEIAPPIVFPKEYNGAVQYSGLISTEDYRVREEGGVSVGSYPVALVLNDAQNCTWTSTTDAELIISFEIKRAKNRFLSVNSCGDRYEGDAATDTASALFGEAEIEYYTSLGSPLAQAPSTPGEYYFIPRVGESENYLALVGERVYFRVIADYAVGIRLHTPPTKTDYFAFDEADITGAVVYLAYESGRQTPLDNSLLTVVYKNGSCISALDTSFFLYLDELFCPVPISVSRIEYDISDLEISDRDFIYNGSHQAPTVLGEWVGLDGIPLEYKISGGGSEVGEYSVRIEFYSDSPNYILPSDAVYQIKIHPKPLLATYWGTEFTYDRLPHAPRGEVTLLSGETLPLEITAFVKAGDYIAEAILPDKNYTLENPTVAFTIKKADIPLDGVIWEGQRFVYDGRAKSVYLTGLPEGVTVLGYANATATEAGSYTAVATLGYDTENYNKPGAVELVWEIARADYSTDSFDFCDAVFTYDGELHYPALRGALPIGLDGIGLTYTFSRGVRNASEGEVSVEIIFSTESQNYNIPSSLFATVKIEPKPISVLWQGGSFIYDGELHSPSATAAECAISVVGGRVNAGEYIAEAVAENPNYMPINASMPFVIEKCENAWRVPPSVTDIYESGTPSPVAASEYGRVIFEIYGAWDLDEPLDGISGFGDYFIRAYVPEGDNYFSLEYPLVPFRVIQVVPESIRVEILADKIIATRPIVKGDISAFVINNDRSESELDFSDISIEYEQKSYPVFGDSYIRVSYCGVSVTVPVLVERCSYDLSELKWEGCVATYDGSPKMAYLTGVPEGIIIKSYNIDGALTVGEYEIYANIEYDEENFYKPNIPKCTLKIEKCKLKLPYIPPITYDGGVHTAKIEENPLYTFAEFSAKNSGRYQIPLTLLDSENYEFEGDAFAIFEILPIEIYATVLSGGRSYRIDKGRVLDGETLGAELYEKDGYIHIRSNNPNYEIYAAPIKSDEGRIWLGVISFILVIILALLVFTVFRNKDSIRELLLRLKNMKRESEKNVNGECNMNSLTMEPVLVTDKAHADSLIPDSLAKSLIGKMSEKIITAGRARAVVYTDTLSEEFSPNDEININTLKARGIIDENASHVKIAARGVIDKPLRILANEFDLSAVKMIKLTAGEAIVAKTKRQKGGRDSSLK